MLNKWSSLLVCSIITLSFPMDASIIKKPPTKSIESTFSELVCTAEDQANIYEIISTMGENNKLNLLLNQTHLKEVGAKINHVHPLKLLAVAFSQPYLKSCMRSIWDDYFKRNGFLDGLAPSMSREADKGKILIYVDDFAKIVNAPADRIRELCNAREWGQLVVFLINS